MSGDGDLYGECCAIDYIDDDGHLCWRVNQLDGDANGRYLECSFFSGRFYQSFYGCLYGF